MLGKKNKKKAVKKVEKVTVTKTTEVAPLLVVGADGQKIDVATRIKALEDSVEKLSKLVNDAVSSLIAEKGQAMESAAEVDEQEAEVEEKSSVDKPKMNRLLKTADGDTIPVLKAIIEAL